MNHKENVLITGASSGIGLELARQFAMHGHTIILTAPVEGELTAIAEEFNNRYGVGVHVAAADLTDINAPISLFNALEARGLQVDILVNDAGRGFRGEFSAMPLEKDLTMTRLNIEAVVAMSKLFVAPMIERGYGRILNVASVAGFIPGPQLAVYHATKAFVVSFSEALATELENKGISVTALCPGPVDTDFFPKANMVDTHAFQDSNLMSPQEVAKEGFEAAMKGERVVIPGGMNKLMIFASHFVPESIQAKMNKRMYDRTDYRERKRNRGDVERKAQREDALV